MKCNINIQPSLLRYADVKCHLKTGRDNMLSNHTAVTKLKLAFKILKSLENCEQK